MTDTIFVTNWHGSQGMTAYIPAIISAIAGMGVALFVHWLQGRTRKRQQLQTSYNLLTAIYREMYTNLTTIAWFIKAKENGSYAQSLLIDIALNSSLTEFVRSAEDVSPVHNILSFYREVSVINAHQIEGIRHPVGDAAEVAFSKAVSFAQDKQDILHRVYRRTWIDIVALSDRGGFILPEYLRLVDCLLGFAEYDHISSNVAWEVISSKGNQKWNLSTDAKNWIDSIKMDPRKSLNWLKLVELDNGRN